MTNLIKSKFLFILFIFLIVFDPPLNKYLKFESILLLLSILLLFTKYKNHVNGILIKCNISNITIAYLLLLFYAITCTVYDIIIYSELALTVYASSFIQIVVSFMFIVLFSVFVVAVCVEYKLELESLIYIYIIAGLMQCFFTISTFLIPSFKEIIINIIIKNANEHISSISNSLSLFRMFGFSSNLFDMFGYATAILTLLAILMGFYIKPKFLLYAPLLFIMPFLNARTGVLIVMFGLFIIFVSLINFNFNLLKVCLYLPCFLLFCIFLIFLMNITQDYSPDTFQWINLGFNEIKNLLFYAEKTGTFSTLLSSNFWKLPEGIRVVFGTGHIAPRSDVGYVNIVWLLGLLGAFWLFMLYLYIFLLAYLSAKNKFERSVVMVLVLSFWLYMFKLNPIGFNSASVITFPICFMIIYNRNPDKSNST